MTTIAFKDGVLAADRLSTEGSDRYGFCPKIGMSFDDKGRSCLYAACGNSALCHRFKSWAKDEDGLRAGAPPPAMEQAGTKAWGFLFYEDGKFWTFDPGLPPYVLELHQGQIHAFGSGGEYALGAMSMGASPHLAIQIAARFDVSTGDAVDVVEFGA